MHSYGSKMKVAITGLGKAAWKYDLEMPEGRRSHTRSILEVSGFELVGGYDFNPNVAESWSKHFDLPIFRSFEEMINKCNPDLVVVAVPIENLFSSLQNILMFSTRIKVLVEKPVISSEEQYSKLLEIEEVYKNRVLVNLPRLFAPETHELAALLNSEGAGVPKISGTYSGSLLNTSLHFITLLNYLKPNIFWVCNQFGDFSISIESENENLEIGRILYKPERADSSFDFTLIEDKRKIDYKDGGYLIDFTNRGQVTTIKTSRDRYQENVYKYISEQGFKQSLRIAGLFEILPSLQGMLSNYEAT